MSAFFWILAVLVALILLSLVIGALIERYAVERDEDEELLHPFGARRLP